MNEVPREKTSFHVPSARFQVGFIPEPIGTKAFFQTISTFLDHEKAQ